MTVHSHGDEVVDCSTEVDRQQWRSDRPVLSGFLEYHTWQQCITFFTFHYCMFWLQFCYHCNKFHHHHHQMSSTTPAYLSDLIQTSVPVLWRPAADSLKNTKRVRLAGIFTRSPTHLGPDFRKILRQSYDNLRIFVQYRLILRQIYDITTSLRTLLPL